MKRLLLLSLALLVFMCSGFSFSDVDISGALDAGADAFKAVTLTEAEIAQLGKEVAAQMDAENTVAANNSPYTQRLNKIMKGLSNEDGLTLNFKVYMTSDINAFALPDGSIRVYSGLMDLMTDEEIYFVLGHEIGHVKNGDTADRFRLAYTTSAARKGAAATGGAAAALSASELGDVGEELLHAQFSQAQESAADEYGLRLMQKYQRDTASAVSALRKLAQLGGSADMFSSHPDSNVRADKIEALRNK